MGANYPVFEFERFVITVARRAVGVLLKPRTKIPDEQPLAGNTEKTWVSQLVVRWYPTDRCLFELRTNSGWGSVSSDQKILLFVRDTTNAMVGEYVLADAWYYPTGTLSGVEERIARNTFYAEQAQLAADLMTAMNQMYHE